jgi:hypothetical protein
MTKFVCDFGSKQYGKNWNFIGATVWWIWEDGWLGSNVPVMFVCLLVVVDEMAPCADVIPWWRIQIICLLLFWLCVGNSAIGGCVILLVCFSCRWWTSQACSTSDSQTRQWPLHGLVTRLQLCSWMWQVELEVARREPWPTDLADLSCPYFFIWCCSGSV